MLIINSLSWNIFDDYFFFNSSILSVCLCRKFRPNWSIREAVVDQCLLFDFAAVTRRLEEK